MSDHKNNDRGENETGAERETNYSGAFGERNRNTPGRTPRELGLDPARSETTRQRRREAEGPRAMDEAGDALASSPDV